MNDYGYKPVRGLGHTVAPRGKRVKVNLHTGESFVAKFKSKESGWHYFLDHDRIKSKLIYSISILTTAYKS